MDIAIYTLKSLAYTLSDPMQMLILVVLGFVLYSKNKKTTVMQKMIIGEQLNSTLELTISQIVMGIFGGVLASLILTYCGVMFDENSGIYLLFMISIILMFWNQRFICFAYGGAVLGFISLAINEFYPLIAGKPLSVEVFRVDVVALMTLVGVLHVVEGVLIIFDGSRGSIPVFTSRGDKIIGGFALRRYWPLPIVILLVINGGAIAGGETVNTPNWWPLVNLSFNSEFLKTAVIASLPLYGVLGYTSVTFTRKKNEKALLSGVSVLTYGIILSFLAQTAAYGLVFKVLVLIIAPTAHEVMLKLQKYMEVHGKPKYNSEGDGLMVLEVAPGSPAEKMGIQSGDTLLEINNNKILNEKDIMEAISGVINYVSLKLLKSDGKEAEASYTNLSKEKKIGIVFVPKSIPNDRAVVDFQEGQFKEMLDKIKKKDDEE
jgi:hypothetical protein